MTAVVLKGAMAVCVFEPRWYHGKRDGNDEREEEINKGITAAAEESVAVSCLRGGEWGNKGGTFQSFFDEMIAGK